MNYINDNRTIRKDNNFTYYIDYAKRTVACVFKNCNTELLDFFFQLRGESYFLFTPIKTLKSKLSSFYTGKAKCAPEDMFDLEYGMKLARNRALYKYYKDYLTVYGNLMNKIDDYVKAATQCESAIAEKLYKYELLSKGEN